VGLPGLPAGEPLTVALDVTVLCRPSSGIGRVTANLLAGLRQRAAVEVCPYVISLRCGRRHLEHEDGLRARWLPLPAGVAHRAWQRIDWPPARWWARDARVVHGTNYVVPPARGHPEVVTVNDLSFVHDPDSADPPARRFPGLIRRAVRRGAFVHVPTEAVRREVVDFFDAEPGRVVSLGYGTTTLAGDPDRGRAAAGGRRFILTVGNETRRKNIPVVVDAFGAIAEHDPEIRLVLVGGPGDDSAAIDRAVARVPHGRDRIVRLGRVADEDLADLLSAASAFVMPTSYEGFGLPVLEAMATGVPVVAADVPAVAEIAGGAARLVGHSDPQTWATEIDRVVSDGGVAARMAELGRARAAEFSWDRFYDGMVELYARAAGDCR
jgi:glycosyltransferase involved in cell wall biosynthesis